MATRLSEEDLHELERLDDLCARRCHAEAIPGFEALLARNPSHGLSVYLYAKALRVTRQPTRGSEIIARADRLAPSDPYIGLVLAWSARDAGDHARAVALSRGALELAPLRGDALQIAARERELAGAYEAARALYLESYEAKPMLDVLAACEGLSQIERVEAPAPWPIGFVARRWLFRAVELELAAKARARFGEVSAARAVTAGCDHTTRLTAAWADRARVDRLGLYRALADRGGFCDCEVVMNASKGDDEDVEVLLVAGRVEGEVPDELASFFEEARVAPPLLAASPAIDRERETTRADAFAVQSHAGGAEIAPQLVFDGLLADLAVSSHALPRVAMVVVAPDLLDAELVAPAELVVMTGGQVVTSPLSRPPQRALLDAMPWVGRALAALDAAIPRTTASIEGRRELGDEGSARLVVRTEAGAALASMPSGSPLLPVPASLVRSRDTSHTAWVARHRTRLDVWVEDRVAERARRVATGRYGARLAFDAQGTGLFAVLDASVIRLDLASGARTPIVAGEDFALGSDGESLAVVRGPHVFLVRDGSALHAPFEGRSPVWSPRCDRLAYLARDPAAAARNAYQVHVLDLASGVHRRVGPSVEEACWPSFTHDGRALVVHARISRRQVPMPGGKVWIDDSERLWLIDLDRDDEPRVLHATNGGSLRIVAPLAHPSLPIVAFRTEYDPVMGEPRRGQRLALVAIDREEEARTWVEGPHAPIAWLS